MPLVLRRFILVGAAVVSIAMGVIAAWTPDRRVEPSWSDRLAPIIEAPLQPGHRVGIVTPAELDEVRASWFLLEAAWLRPDVSWRLVDRRVGSMPVDRLLAVGPAPIPAGWRVVWRRDGVQLLVAGDR